MRILFDQGTPVPLREALTEHEVQTTYELAWSRMANGALLDAAEAAGFNVLITTDKNLRHQQNLEGRKLAILVLPTTRWPRIRGRVADVVAAVRSIQPGTYLELT